MQQPGQSAKEYWILLAIRYFFGGHALVSGLNHYFLFIPEIMPRDPELAYRFMSSLVDSGMYDLVKITEIICGISLLTGRFMPLALVLEMPITVIICYLSLFMAPTVRSVYSGPRELIFNAVLLVAYWGWFRTVFFTSTPVMRPIWRRDPLPGAELSSAKGDA